MVILQKPEPCGICDGKVTFDSKTRTITCKCKTIATPKSAAYYDSMGWTEATA
jgi:hypothetical protein